MVWPPKRHFVNTQLQHSLTAGFRKLRFGPNTTKKKSQKDMSTIRISSRDLTKRQRDQDWETLWCFFGPPPWTSDRKYHQLKHPYQPTTIYHIPIYVSRYIVQALKNRQKNVDSTQFQKIAFFFGSKWKPHKSSGNLFRSYWKWP